MISLDSLVGKILRFYGASSLSNSPYEDLIFTDVGTFKSLYNNCDDYRSYCDGVELQELPPHGRTNFVELKVTRMEHRHVDGWELKDGLGNVWLKVGTDNSDDYYPSYNFVYTPQFAL